jgi:hypothetical protein
MKLLAYQDYISESILNQLLLESKLVLSPKFINILSRIKNNKISDQLISLNRKDVDGIKQNYIDITDDNDKASFTPDKRAQQLNNNKEDVYKVTQGSRYLTHSDKNNKVFEALGYDKENNTNWAPDVGTKGLVLNETTRPSGNTYVLFQEYESESPRLSVLNKQAIELDDDVDNKQIWSTSRNPMNVGRLVRSILTTSGFDFTNIDVEDFVNKYKAMYDFSKDALKQFDVVSGKKIAYWYHQDNYVSGGGTLNNSCMSDVDEEYFDIYSYNDNISLVILYGDDGEFDSEGNYISDLIKGRAILWTCEIDGTPGKFMDRIYTTLGSDVELFKQYAEKNGWWYKKTQSMDPEESITDGTNTKTNSVITCKLSDADWESYPYMDTMCYISTSRDIVTNQEKHPGVDRVARDTGGDYEYVDEEYDEEYDD